MRWVMRMPSLFLSCVMCVCHNMSILLEILWLSDCPSESCCFELGSKVREFGCHIPTRMSLSLYSKGGLDIGFGSWQDVDAKKAALLVKSYLSITRGWTKDCVRECKLGRSTNPNRYTPMSSSWCWWVCFLFHACELFSYLGWFGHLFVYLIFIIPIMIIFGFGCFEICHLFLTSCQGHYVISQVAWTLYPICWLTVLASWHRSLQCNPQIKHVEVPKKTG